MQKSSRIGIVGYGYVGKAVFQFLKNHFQTFVYDEYVTGPDNIFTSQEQINTCDLAIICVPTPKRSDGACDTKQVEDVVHWLKTPLILIKSTVPVGTTDCLKAKTGKRIVFSPEYCGESSYWTPYAFHKDMKEAPYYIFGGSPEDTNEIVNYYLQVVGPVKKYVQTSSKVAELAKYMENTFFATKIAYCYEIACICEALDVPYNEVREAWLLDPRINPMHTAVFAQNSKPFSGKCLPKDLSALIHTASQSGYSAELLKEVLKTNERIGDMRVLKKAA